MDGTVLIPEEAQNLWLDCW